MRHAAKSILAFSLVFINGGLLLLLAPRFVLSFLGFSFTELLFPRFVGMTMLVLAYYYVRAAWNGLTEFFKWTVHIRLMGVIFYIAFVVLGIAPVTILGFALLDLLGALWTNWALAADERGIS